MKFRNQIHKKEFSQAIAKIADLHSAAAAAIYLLSADKKLWNAAKRNIHGNEFISVKYGRNNAVQKHTRFYALQRIYIKTRNI